MTLYYYNPELQRWAITFKECIVYVEGEPARASAYDRASGKKITNEDYAEGSLSEWLGYVAEELSSWTEAQKLGCSLNKEVEKYDPFTEEYL